MEKLLLNKTKVKFMWKTGKLFLSKLALNDNGLPEVLQLLIE